MNRVLLVGLALFLGTACGTPAPLECGSTCKGCCTADGRCEVGDSQAACGLIGSQCVACGAAQTCSLGSCAGPVTTSDGGTCKPTTCKENGATCGSIADGCGGTLSCGTCSGVETCGGSGTANVCGPGTCTPTTCASQKKNCGSISDGCSSTLSCGTCTSPSVCGANNECSTVCTPKTCTDVNATCGSPSDGCGGTLDCGTCTMPLTCGAGGIPFACGGACLQTCPAGYTCSPLGVCAGGDRTNIVLDVLQAPSVTVSGTVTLNGAKPFSDCGSSARAYVYFESAANPNYNTRVTIPCNGATTDFEWLADLYPSTYKVSVQGLYSALPDWKIVTTPALAVTVDAANVVLNVVQAPQVMVSGTVTLNGLLPFSGCTSAARATVSFKSANSNYDTSVQVPCDGATTPFTWEIALYPSTYQVRVEGLSSDLPQWEVLVNPAMVVTASVANVALNVAQADAVLVSGVVTLNGVQPFSDCGSSARATVYFESTINPNYNTSVTIPCNGATTPFAWETPLYPSTYKVSVKGLYSELPDWQIVTNPALVVTAAVSNVTLNVVQAAAVPISGIVTLNGSLPGSTCGSSARATVNFKSANANYNTSAIVPCNGATTPFAWSVELYPSTYEVSVTGGFSDLPDWSIVTNPALVVTAASSNVTLNVVQAPTVIVMGTVTLNGVRPNSECSSAARATVYFTSANANYNTSVTVPCNGATTPFAWEAELYPSTYAVSVLGGSSSLPSWRVAVLPSLSIASTTDNVTLNVVQAPTVQVMGTILLNGMLPYSGCSSSARATVNFKSANANYNETVTVPCNGATSPFAWSVDLYPSTYEVSVTGASSDLPGWKSVVIQALDVR